ncbi:TPA: polysaccharide pyruvyl transferase family protein [Campylobacter coli]|uniref:polysaccharide pyruvyl transferase family protein n=1 Tax=Campylobacter coli TaxID=195 RepID=UPI000931AC13|nr:polysaccharide pyruvyl transferase family protein [Campylobacter coli]HEB7537249.1 polysaccharide pyruvyl transferase family protein [Campylobacter coli]HEB7551127.1 polysaccharide pyruvyl transferase family protein [Campylobacter coli]
MQRICVFGAKNAPFINTLDARQKLHLSGNNFGNYLIGYAIDRQIKNCDFYDFYDSSIAMEEINEKYDKVVMPLSNFINHAYNLQSWADFLDKLKIPIVFIGIGAQTLDEASDIKLQPGTLRYIKVISERCRTIGARGEFTASTLNKLGIYNVDVIGCHEFR